MRIHSGILRLGEYPLVFLFIDHFFVRMTGEYKMCWLAQGKVFGFALGEFGLMLYRFDSGDKRNDGFDLFGAVIELATYLGMTQETAVTKFL